MRAGVIEGEWFQVRVGLRQGSIMSPTLLNMNIDGVVMEMKERGMKREAAVRRSEKVIGNWR